MNNLLLDTCAVIWIGSDQVLKPEAVKAMDDAFDHGRPVSVSPYSAWELGVLVSKSRINFPQPVEKWFGNFMQLSGTILADLTPEVFVASSFLPGSIHKDPADRIIIATAREYGMTILTRDQKILDYADQGHVNALRC